MWHGEKINPPGLMVANNLNLLRNIGITKRCTGEMANTTVIKKTSRIWLSQMIPEDSRTSQAFSNSLAIFVCPFI